MAETQLMSTQLEDPEQEDEPPEATTGKPLTLNPRS